MSRVSAALDRVDPELGMFISLDVEGALERERDVRPGRLSGEPIAVKDSFDVAGMATTYGSALYGDEPARRDAPVIASLREQGAIVIGKTSMHEFAYGVTSYNPHHPTPLVPRDRSRTAGGSSGGSAAAVAAGVCRIALGGDTSGSVRIPAACCGVYGLKLTYGAVDLDGVGALSPRYDSLGLFGAEVSDLQRALGIESLPDPRTIRVGRIGVDLEAPPLPMAAHLTVFRQGVWEVWGPDLERRPDAIGRDVARKLRLPIGDVDGALAELDRWRERFESAVADFDVLIDPVLDGIAPTLAAARADYERDDDLANERLLRRTPIYNELGWAALTVPTADGPLQLAGPPGSEPRLLSVATTIGLSARDTVVG